MAFVNLSNKNTNLIAKVRNEFLSGRPVILVDEEREVEADFIYPAELISNEVVNFFVTYGKGLFCVVGPELDLMQRGFFKLPSNYNANYFITLDYLRDDLKCIQTGIPADERAFTCQKISDISTRLSDFKYPGHVTLIGAKDFWYRKGHSESSIELVKMSGFRPYSVIIEILDEQGNSHNLDYIYEFAKKNNLLVLSINDVWREYIKNNNLLSVKSEAILPTEFGTFRIISFERTVTSSKGEYANMDSRVPNINDFALVRKFDGVPIVRIHSECVTGDCLGSIRCDCGSQLNTAVKLIQKYGGVLLYLRQEGRGIGLDWKVKAYELQDKGFDTYDANVTLGFKPDERDYAIAVQMLKALKITKVRLLTNNPEKVKQLENYGIEVLERIPLYGNVTKSNAKYIKTKIEKFGHVFDKSIDF